MKMKRNKCKSILIALIALFVCGLNVLNVFADGKNGESTMTISPMTQKIILMPGETKEVAIKVSNPYLAKQNLEYSVSVGSFSQSAGEDSRDDYDSVDTGTKTEYNQIMDWITLGKDSGTVAPNEVDLISFTINVPNDAPAGGQYATILVTDETDYMGDRDGNVSIESKMQIGSIIYAEVTGATREEGKILENNIPSFLLNNQLEATSMVRNDGNVHTDASYILQVWPMIGDEEICTNEEEPSESLVLPETERYHTESCNLPAVGIFRAKQTVKIFGETSIVEKIIIVCPIWLMFIIIFVIFALIFYFVTKVKARKKAAKKAEKSA